MLPIPYFPLTLVVASQFYLPTREKNCEIQENLSYDIYCLITDYGICPTRLGGR
jgi:hypothetical protein